jgi:hypothetical protein
MLGSTCRYTNKGLRDFTCGTNKSDTRMFPDTLLSGGKNLDPGQRSWICSSTLLLLVRVEARANRTRTSTAH